jgi:flavin reductase (DIM6/NTAB) family NADH-FMN oxidoreductase RutF
MDFTSVSQAAKIGNPPTAESVAGRGRRVRCTEAELMTESSRPSLTPLAHALGKVPSGIYILTVRDGARATGMLASWVQQAGFDPPALTVAVGRQRYVGDWIEASGRFTLNQLAAGSRSLIRHFGRGFDPGAPAFEGVELLPDEVTAGGPVLAAAMAYLDAEVAGELTVGDHRVFLARVVAGAVRESDAEPLVHLRNNGLHY